MQFIARVTTKKDVGREQRSFERQIANYADTITPVRKLKSGEMSIPSRFAFSDKGVKNIIASSLQARKLIGIG